MRSKKVLKKWFQRVPKWTPKVAKIDKSVFWRGLKKRPQKWTLSRIRKSKILPLLKQSFNFLRASRSIAKTGFF